MFVKICWAITLLATALAGLDYFSAMADANGAPQQAAGAAMAAALVVIPYVFTRGVEGLARGRKKAAPTKECPRCSESVLKTAHVCRYCGHDFDGRGVQGGASEPAENYLG